MKQKHLGGHKGRTHIDKGILQFAKEVLDCKSVVDIGCGPGGQVYEALNLGMNAMGVDGDTTLQWEKPIHFIRHDFTESPLEHKEVDMVWCCEFIEHVEEKYIPNYMSIMKSAKYVFVTYSEPGKPGHHHVNCQPKQYWIDIFNENGFDYAENLTVTSKEYSTMVREFWNENGLIFKRK
jgi:SAM-dependent methyltransferase